MVSSQSPLLISNPVTPHNWSEQEVALLESFADWQDVITQSLVCCCNRPSFSRALERELRVSVDSWIHLNDIVSSLANTADFYPTLDHLFLSIKDPYTRNCNSYSLSV